VVCGAGASSTFVAQRLRRAARDAGVPLTATAGSEASLAVDIETADVVLVGPHHVHRIEEITRLAEDRDVRVALLPDDIFRNDPDGSRALALATAGTTSIQH